MSENCSHDCSSCSSDCKERQGIKKEVPNKGSRIKKVIAVASGKGGVGKSFVTCMLASLMNKKGFKTAILDADITGPSIPKAFGIKTRPGSQGESITPVKSQNGVSIMSLNLLLDNETDPVVWRGPVIAGAVTQFWTDVIWGDVDYMFVDMPPGTGDVPLTVFQSLPVDGIIMVSTPQQLVSMIVEKAVSMANMMNIPILGFVENMSYVQCPDCKKRIEVFGKSQINELSSRFCITATGRLPLDPAVSKLCDEGNIESLEIDNLDKIVEMLSSLK